MLNDTPRWAIVADGGPELIVLPRASSIFPRTSSLSTAHPRNIIELNDIPIEVIGSGFIPGIPGIFANTTIPAPTSDDTDASLISPDSPAETPQISDTSTESQPSAKARAVKANNKD